MRKKFADYYRFRSYTYDYKGNVVGNGLIHGLDIVLYYVKSCNYRLILYPEKLAFENNFKSHRYELIGKPTERLLDYIIRKLNN